MSWHRKKANLPRGTPHLDDCKRMFERKDPRCPRCQELLGGAPPRTWLGDKQKAEQAARLADLKRHFESEKHRSGGCGLVCTYGDW